MESINITKQRLLCGFFGAIILILAFQSFREPSMPNIPPPEPEKPCKGQAIYVDYEYPPTQQPSPWECEVQCNDDEERYVHYTNDFGTQCEAPPGCLDLGEDNNVTCTIKNTQSTVEAN